MMHPYRGAPCIWQIIKPMPQPISIRNWRFRAVNCLRRYQVLYRVPQFVASDIPF